MFFPCRNQLRAVLAALCLSTAATLHAQAPHATNAPPGAAELKKMQPAAGLKLELFAAEPQLQNPVAFSIDEKGRFFIVETHRYKESIFDITKQPTWLLRDLSFRSVADRTAFLTREFATNLVQLTKDSELLRLVEDRDGDGRADASSIFATGFNDIPSGTAAGVLARKGEVWFTCIPDLWRLKESPGSGAAESRQKLHAGYGVHIGVTGHDLHGLCRGPDGRLYFSSGDRGFSVTNAEGKVLHYPDTGGVLRCNPDGSNLEVFATGLRNPQELAFDQFGNLWTDDNDTAGPDDSRVVHVVEGGDYGWRCSYQHQAGFGPWVQEAVWRGGIDDALPHAGTVAQGPSGLAFYPGTGLPDRYQNQFLVCDFPGGIWSFGTEPAGASYRVTGREKFLWNLWPTDVDFGPDGAVYVADWVSGWTQPEKGRLYRLTDAGQTNSAAARELKGLLAGDWAARPVAELISLLEHRDLRVRTEAHFTLADLAVAELVKEEGLAQIPADAAPDVIAKLRRPREGAMELLKRTAAKSEHQLARVHAIWGLRLVGLHPKARTGKAEALRGMMPLRSDADAEIRAQAAAVIGDCQLVWPTAFESLAYAMIQDPSPRVRFHATLSFGKLKFPQEQAPLVVAEMIRQNNDADPYLTHAGVTALLSLTDAPGILRLAQAQEAPVRRAALLCLRRLGHPAVAQFLGDPEAALVKEAARAINDVPITAALPDLAKLADHPLELKKRFTRYTAYSTNPPPQISPFDMTLRRAINAQYRLGQAPNAAALAALAGTAEVPETMRVASLEALTEWPNPNPLDRIMGLWRPLPPRDHRLAQAALQPVIGKLLEAKSENVVVAAIIAARTLQLSETAPTLAALYENARTTPAMRVEILPALAAFKASQLGKAVELALADPVIAVRREAIKWVEQINPAAAAPLLEKLLATESDLRINQTVLTTLGQLNSPAADAVLEKPLDDLLNGKLKAELRLDLIEAAARRKSPGVKDRLKRYEAGRPANDPLAVYRETLAGGDAAEGKKIFHERAGVECLRCHAIRGTGGIVGPDLAGIGTRQKREYLLEAIVLPNQQIAPGYENVTVTLKDGRAFGGVAKSETANELVLDVPEDGLMKLKKNDIQQRVRGLSAMPDGMANQLTKQDLRNLVEYLATVK
jgi:quinoprotein glucose dehydrogenase